MKHLLALLSLAAIIARPRRIRRRSDDQFLAALTASGVTYQDPGKVIAAAKWVCQTLNQGMQMADVVRPSSPKTPDCIRKRAKFTALALAPTAQQAPAAGCRARAAAAPGDNG